MVGRAIQSSRGGAGVWALIVVLAVAMAFLLLLAWRASGPGPAAGPPTAADHAQLEALQAKLRNAIANQRMVTPMIPEAQRLVARHPNMTEARVTLAQMLVVNQRLPDAYEQLTEVLAQDPDQAQVQLLAGSLQLQRGLPVEAEPHYRAAVALEPAEGGHRVFLAQCLVQQGRLDDAERVLTEAIGIDGTLHAASGMLADIYEQQDQIEMALSQAQRARQAVPRDDDRAWAAYTRRYARLLRRVDQPAESLLVLRELPPQTHFDKAVAAEMASSWEMLGQPEKAAAHYEAALLVNPLDDASAAEAAAWYLKAGDTDRARQMIDEVKRINPRSPRLAELEAAMN